jgi:hypothetical protein
VLALETDLRLKQQAFADPIGLPLDDTPLLIPGAVEVAWQEAAKSKGVLAPSVDLVAQVGRERLSGGATTAMPATVPATA